MDKKRFLGILLATLFVLSLLPGAQLTTASAEEMAVARAMEAGEVNRSTVSSVSVQFVDAGNVGAFAKAANGGSANVSVTGPVSTTGTPVSPQNPNSPTIANGAVAEATGARSNATAVVGNGVSVDTGYIAYGAVARSVEGGKAGLTVRDYRVSNRGRSRRRQGNCRCRRNRISDRNRRRNCGRNEVRPRNYGYCQ